MCRMVSQDASRQSLAESIAMSSRIMLEREGRDEFFLQIAECYSFSRSLPSPFLHPIPMSLSLLISFSIYNIYCCHIFTDTNLFMAQETTYLSSVHPPHRYRITGFVMLIAARPSYIPIAAPSYGRPHNCQRPVIPQFV